MNIKEMKLPQVLLILGLLFMILTAVVILTLHDKDSAGVYAFGGSILLGLGIVAGVTGQVASNTNGNTTRMLDMMAEQSRNTTALLSLLTPSSAAAEAKVMELASATTNPLPQSIAPVSVPPATG
jgi:uncharacterized integral membrane protein